MPARASDRRPTADAGPARSRRSNRSRQPWRAPIDPKRPLAASRAFPCGHRSGKATTGRPGARCPDGLRCSALRRPRPGLQARPAARGARPSAGTVSRPRSAPPLTSFAVVERRPRVSLRSALTRAASGPAMLGVLKARPRPARRRLADAARRAGEHHRRCQLAWAGQGVTGSKGGAVGRRPAAGERARTQTVLRTVCAWRAPGAPSPGMSGTPCPARASSPRCSHATTASVCNGSVAQVRRR